MANPNASRLKLSRRRAGSLISPTMCWTQMWKSAKEEPTETATTGRSARPGKAAATVMPAITPQTATMIGFLVPMRSTRRPEKTPSAMGSAAMRETSEPTTSGVAPSESASSENVRRVPLYAVCVRTVMKTSSASGIRALAFYAPLSKALRECGGSRHFSPRILHQTRITTG